MDTPIYLGRDFSWHDSAGSPKVAIVNQTLARQYFGDKSAIGARVVSKDGTTYEIIAVVGDAKYLELRETVPPTLYLHAFQQERVSSQFALRAERSADDLRRGSNHGADRPRSGVPPEPASGATRSRRRASH
jgi:hypothetical protein